MLLGLSYWVIFGLALTLAGGVLYRLLPRDVGRRLGQQSLRWLFCFFIGYLRFTDLIRLDDSTLATLPRKIDGPLILAPNHLALWDAVFLIAACPRPLCVMKNSILHNPLLGGGARLAGFIPNEPRTRMIREAAAAVRGGEILILFPEGTRTRPDEALVNPLKGGCGIIACQAGAAVRPVFMRSNCHFLEKGWPPWRKPRFPVHVSIELGEPLTPAPGESPQDFTRRLQEVFERELARPHPLRRIAASGENSARRA
jgi:1-acyl-sn-glycerol-3-phosphate acyltransferase